MLANGRARAGVVLKKKKKKKLVVSLREGTSFFSSRVGWWCSRVEREIAGGAAV